MSLEWIAASDRPWAADRARSALEMISQRDAGLITPDEYQELAQDLVNMDRLNEEADDLELKNMLVAAVMLGTKLL
jgi:hypothetical protein